MICARVFSWYSKSQIVNFYIYDLTWEHDPWHLFGPKLPWWLIPVTLLIFVIETLGTFIIRPASLSLRLTGNMNGDHTILGFAYNAVPYFLPLLAYGLGLFVSLIQSFVFTLLSIIYVLLSLEHDDHH